MRLLLWMMLCLPAFAAQPVLVELFTSEGCSSCPPADTLLRKLASDSHVIAISEHVDYWNHLGWQDPFSSSQMTARQEGYAAKFGARGPYTPQMVVDGAEEFVGSDAGRAAKAIETASARPKLDLRAEVVDHALRVTAPAAAAKADLWLAVTYDPEPSQVARGENSGRKLIHVSVLKSMVKVGEIGKGKGFDGPVPIPAQTGLRNARIIVFAQDRDRGRIVGLTAVQ